MRPRALSQRMSDPFPNIKVNLLHLTHRLPWPPIDGGKKCMLGFVDGYRLHSDIERHVLLSMCPEEEAEWARTWKPQGTELHVELVDARNSALRVIGNTLFSSLPFNMAKYKLDSFDRLVCDAIHRDPPDIVQFESTHTAAYAKTVRRLAPKALRILRSHNAEHVILQRLAESETNPVKKAVIGLQARRLHDYEASALDEFDLILAITEADAARFRAMNPRIAGRMIVVPAGADLPAALPSAPADNGAIRLLHVAAMDWLPNQSGLRWLIENVIPRLDDAGLDYHLDIVGKNMPEEFSRYATERITVHGFVEDLAPITSKAHIAMVPLQVGGGMRVKILDYWAMGIPVVSTAVGAEGLVDGDEQALVVADNAADFAAALLHLAASASTRDTLRSAAFRKVSASFGWRGIIDGLVQRFSTMVRDRARGES